MDDILPTNGEEKESKEGIHQLLDSTYPLLQRFREACPGTYKHCQSLSAMIESISIALSLDVTKMKIAAQYHDIGKILNPKYFVENQLEDEDPHEKLSAFISYNLITRHVADSIAILINDHSFPRDIIEMISQHHGTTVVKYFFTKSGIDIEDTFRYRTAKPTCVESAVLMVCDRVEATSRSLIQSNKFDTINVVDSTINSLLDDGQLDSVYMKLGDLKRIKEALTRELEGTYQKRVDYSKVKKNKDSDIQGE